MRITSKNQYIDMWLAGAFGNRPHAWQTLQDVQYAGFRSAVARHRRAMCKPWVCDVRTLSTSLHVFGVQSHDLFFNEVVPNHGIILQGEVMVSERHLELRYSQCSNLFMWQAMQAALNVNGLKAHLLLKSHLCPNSYDNLQYLFDKYEGAVVEFTCYSRDVGNIPNHNTIFWEVRHY